MIRYAAVASDGSRARDTDRERVDAWAREKCAAGFEVAVYSSGQLASHPGPGPASESERVGLWLPSDS